MLMSKIKNRRYCISVILIVSCVNLFSQNKTFTAIDTLIGSNSPYRSWWDVLHYDVFVKPDFITQSVSGYNTISFHIISDTIPFNMQIDLRDPLLVDSIFFDGNKYTRYITKKNMILISLQKLLINTTHTLQIFYHGQPKKAIKAPWDGGLVWTKDSLGNPWMSLACQGIGASVWIPCKDLQSDEPDNGATIKIAVPDSLTAIANGKLKSKSYNGLGTAFYTWEVKNTINAYNIVPYIGRYSLVKDSIRGEQGTLEVNLWVLNYHVREAVSHLKPSVQKTLSCLEYWFGPYPFYNDTYKIVESPYLGMEHQSNIAYGNGYKNGYLGKDLSATGWGLKWDFIVVHETAHEWFGNSLTATDVADNWIHEGFASYAEVLFTECSFGAEAGNDYCAGIKKSIENDIPVIGNYFVKNEGSGDMYNKGSNIIHMIRQMMRSDEKFRKLLRDISKTFYHKNVSTDELETYIITKTGINLSAFFNQYLRTVNVPVLEYKIIKNKLLYRYNNCVTGFNMQLKVIADKTRVINPTKQWQSISILRSVKIISIDRNMYVTLKQLK